MPEPAPRPDPTSRSAWHRRASRPVLGWMAALVVLALVHRWVPQSRWLLVHLVTLGLLTTSVMIWAQHFADALLRTRSGEHVRSRQVLRLRLLTAAILVAAVGMVGSWPVLAALGATGVAGTVAWFAVDLVRQLRASLPSRFGSLVRGYAIAAAMLVPGAAFGAVLAFGPPPLWQGRLLLAHLGANVLGLVGITVLTTLVTLGPTVLRVAVPPALETLGRRGTVVLPLAVLVVIAGALAGEPLLAAVGVLVVAGFAAATAALLLRAARGARWGELPRFPPFSILAGLLWFTGSLIAAAVMLALPGAAPGAEPTMADLQRLTVPLVGGAGLQVLLGAMSFLMPTVMGGGPRAVRAGLAELSRGATPRVVLLNSTLLILVLADGSWTRVIASVAVFAVLLAFLPLMVRAVRANLRVRAENAGGAGASTTNAGPSLTVGAPESSERLPRRSVGAGAAIGLAGGLGALALGQALDGRGGAGASDGGSVAPSGRAVRARISAHDMRFTPDHVTAGRGDRVVLTVVNDDPATAHDLMLDSGESTGRIAPGAEADLVVRSARESTDGWCTIVGHRGMGMVFALRVEGSEAGAGHPPDPAARAASPERIDLAQAPGEGFETRDPRLPGAPTTEVELVVRESTQEVAPGHRLRAMTYGGRVMGPVLRGALGQGLTVHLRNEGTMGHSLDLHAGTVSPDAVMRTIAPGEALDYRIRTDHAGIWLYHCSTAPMSVHLASGMFGVVVVPPADLAPVDHEWVIVQSEGYLGADAAEVDADAIAAERPSVILWNGHANQYVHAPLTARAGQRVRIWVMSAGPSRAMSFHVVGGVFDTVFREGAYLLRAEDGSGGGSQALALGPAQGGFVELTFAEAGTYTAVSHSFVDMERGARALIRVTD